MANLSDLMNQVFTNDSILEIILEQAIKNENKVCRPTLQNLRLVKSTWLHSTTKILKQWNEPLFKIELSKTNSTTGSEYVKRNGKALDRFIDTVTTGISKFGREVPQFSVKIEACFLVEENFLSFLRFWTHPCTGGLLQVELTLAEEEPQLIAILPKTSFPLLTQLNVTIFVFEEFNGKLWKNMINFTNLIQAFLNGVESPLFQFTLRGTYPPESPTLKYLSLPSTLQKLELSSNHTRAVVEGLLLRDPLPVLSSLSLDVTDIPNVPNGLVFQLLDKLKSTLVSLALLDFRGTPSTVTLPVMENLKDLHLDGIDIELESEEKNDSLESWLPKLESMKVYYHDEQVFQNWREYHTFPKVNNLLVKLWRPKKTDLEIFQIIQRAFKNMTKLTVFLPAMEMAALEYLFGEMKQLVKLRIEVDPDAGNIANSGNRMTSWDSLFTGLPIQMVRRLRHNRNSWGEVDLEKEGCQGIRNLLELTHFDLRIFSRKNLRTRSREPVISELALTLGFLKMSKLKYFNYDDNFSDESRRLNLTTLWQSKG